MAEKPSSFTSIPTIDLAEIDSSSLDTKRKLSKAIYDACHECGFFYIQNHGISEEIISDTFALLKRFFALELEAKMDAHVQKNPAIRGYEPMLETRLDPRTKGGRHEALPLQALLDFYLLTPSRYQRGLYDG